MMTEYFVPNQSHKTLFIAMVAVFTALTTIGTIVFIIPFPSTQGYFNLGDLFVMISGILLGPVGGLVAGGVGSAMGDVLLGFTAFVPVTILAKGLEGFFVGLLSGRTLPTKRVSWWDIGGLVLGSIAMLVGYLLGEMLILGLPFEVAFIELLTINSIQVIMGSIFAITIGPFFRDYLRNYVYSWGWTHQEIVHNN
ncbi:MAG: ECF transporter S component [Candidatus Thorarchaeota archaeon]|jgi:uncharacterized membrane protein